MVPGSWLMKPIYPHPVIQPYFVESDKDFLDSRLTQGPVGLAGCMMIFSKHLDVRN